MPGNETQELRLVQLCRLAESQVIRHQYGGIASVYLVLGLQAIRLKKSTPSQE